MRQVSFAAALSTLLAALLMAGCRQRKLPILGEPLIATHQRNNGQVSDTSYPVIAHFSLIDQDGAAVSNETFSNKIYVADFIFLSCPTICPMMTAEMKKLYQQYAGDDRVLFLSHTIDPKHDTVGRLKSYTQMLGIAARKWHFVTGSRDSIFSLAKHSYYSTAYPDSADPGNFVHSGGLLLVDRNRHLRGVYDGTDPKETHQLKEDIQILLQEQF